MRRRLPAAIVSLAAWLSIGPLPGAAQSVPGLDSLTKPCPPPCCGYDCADSCSNKPFEPTACMTTDYGPARADVVIGANPTASTNMLYCPGGTSDHPQPYALCFFSGPTSATGTTPSSNKTLTCVPDPLTGIANCQCQVYNTGAYYVDINGILNLGAFWQAQKECGHDGSRCKNIAACDANGNQKTGCGTSPCPTCTDKVATVCSYVAAQPFDKEAAFYPGSFYKIAPPVDLISTFSYAMSGPPSAQPNAGYGYQLGSIPCTNGGVYAGCMTAPCTYPPGSTKADGSIVNCACPLWKGDYQIGQNPKDVPASLVCPTAATTGGDWVWSAANAVAASKGSG